MPKRLSQRFLRASVRLGLLCIFMLVLVLPLLLYAHFMPGSFNDQYAFVMCNTRGFFILRWCIIASLWFYWPELIAWCAHKRKWTDKKWCYWTHQRTQILLWLILFELLISENMLALLLKFI